MQFSKNWLKEFIDIDLSTQEICHQLTMAGLEVDGYEDVKSKITGNDSIIKLDITPNRGDCFSVLGVARELAVINNLKFSLPKINEISESFTDDINLKVCKDGPIYFGRTIKNISLKSKTLPLIAERLKLSDQKLIDPVVDITNYILLELGQPLHAFDRQKLNGNITVRLAEEKEKIILLDDQELELDSSCLVISDEKEAVAFAGIMGGKASSVTDKTNSIFLESAFFKPTIIRGKARKFGFQTDASIRFERGVDYEIQELAINRASSLLNSTVGGEFGNTINKTIKTQLPKRKNIEINLNRANQILGTAIPKKEALRFFKGLGLSPQSQGENIVAKSPSWRYDLEIEADLIEELARLEGYDSLPQVSLKPVYKKGNLKPESLISNKLVSKGFNEIITYSFISEADNEIFGQEQNTLRVDNPISQNMSFMRTNLISGLVNTCSYNLNHGQENQRLFEIGNTFHLQNNKKVIETKVVAGLMTGNLALDNWNTKSDEVSFYDLKGVLMDLTSLFDTSFSLEECTKEFLHPGISASIRYKNREVGYIGTLHPSCLENLGLKKNIFIFSLEIDSLELKANSKFKDFSKFPSTSRDLAFLFDRNVDAESIQTTVMQSAGKFFKEISIFDIYEGEGIGPNKKSVALSVSWQAMKKTLLDSDIDGAVDKIIKSVKKDLNGELRI